MALQKTFLRIEKKLREKQKFLKYYNSRANKSYRTKSKINSYLKIFRFDQTKRK
jgi:hypothetical protein